MESITTSQRSSLEYIPPDDLQDVWSIVLPGLKLVRRKSKSHWIPEDVYAQIKTGQATLHIAYVEHTYAGFVIIQVQPHWDGKNFHLWCGFSAGEYDVLEIFLPELERMARSIKAKRMTFWSPRRWDRRIAKFGYVPTQTEYAKEL
jgi:hypothetical protein